MTASHKTFEFSLLHDKKIPVFEKGFFRALLADAIHEKLVKEFFRLSDENKINRAMLARRIGRAPEQVTRWLGAPRNYTIDTISDLSIGLGIDPTTFISTVERHTQSKAYETRTLSNAPSNLLYQTAANDGAPEQRFCRGDSDIQHGIRKTNI